MDEFAEMEEKAIGSIVPVELYPVEVSGLDPQGRHLLKGVQNLPELLASADGHGAIRTE